MRQSIVVTGVSSGIGLGTAQVLASHGFHVFGSVRKTEDAQRVATTLGDAFTPLIFDITDTDAVQDAARQVREQLAGTTLTGLVNNAGIAVPGLLMHMPIEEYRRQLEVNLVGPLIVSQAFVPLLGTDRTLAGKPGRIVNVSSVGGKLAGPFLGPYHASKFGLEGFSESLRRELLLYGIDVIVVGPGAVATPIWDKAEAIDVSQFDSTEYAAAIRKYRDFSIADGRRGLPPERVGTVIWRALTAAHPRVRYAVVPHRLRNWTIPLALPKRRVDRIIARSLGFPHR